MRWRLPTPEDDQDVNAQQDPARKLRKVFGHRSGHRVSSALGTTVTVASNYGFHSIYIVSRDCTLS
jgi:hypothetical protein